MEIKECLTTVKQVFFHYQKGSLVDHRASKPYTLVGSPALRLVLDPLAVKLRDNGLCMLMLLQLAKNLGFYVSTLNCMQVFAIRTQSLIFVLIQHVHDMFVYLLF